MEWPQPAKRGIFLFRVCGIVDQQIGAGDQFQDIGVELARHMLRIGDIADRPCRHIPPDSRSPRWDGSASLSSAPAPSWGRRISPALKSLKLVTAAKMSMGTGNSGATIMVQMTSRRRRSGSKCPAQKRTLLAGSNSGGKNGTPDNVVEMAVGQEQIDVARALALQLLAQWAQARPGIEDQQMRPAADFQARGVAAVALVAVAGAGDTAAHAPEGDGKGSPTSPSKNQNPGAMATGKVSAGREALPRLCPLPAGKGASMAVARLPGSRQARPREPGMGAAGP